ncbi:MAG TPA: hypothetical protein DCR71_05805 [Dehalococcoidia bacterium]|nr:hypothetical protein [Dehalococcoidia bacterium]
MGIVLGYVLGGLLALTGGVFTYFCISEFTVFAFNNLEWLAIILLMMGVASVLGGGYLIYNLMKKS